MPYYIHFSLSFAYLYIYLDLLTQKVEFWLKRLKKMQAFPVPLPPKKNPAIK